MNRANRGTMGLSGADRGGFRRSEHGERRGLLRRRDATGPRKGCQATAAEGATKWRALDGDFSLFK